MRPGSVLLALAALPGCNVVFGLDSTMVIDAPADADRCLVTPTADLTSPYAADRPVILVGGNIIDNARSQALILGQGLIYSYRRNVVDELNAATWDGSSVWLYNNPLDCLRQTGERSPVSFEDGSLFYLSERGDQLADPIGPTRVWHVSDAACTTPPELVPVGALVAGDAVRSISRQPGTSRFLLAIKHADGTDELRDYMLVGGTLELVQALDELSSPCVDSEPFAPTADVLAFSSTRLANGACDSVSRLLWTWRVDPACPYQPPVAVPVPAGWVDVHDPWVSPSLSTLFAARPSSTGYRIERALR